jgi:hypothetical protein
MKSDAEGFYEKLSSCFISCYDCGIAAVYMQRALAGLHFACAVYAITGTANQESKIRPCIT